MSGPGVSIVVPLHDGAGTVIETLDTVRAQTFADWELIVVDDASTDDGPARVRDWAGSADRPVQVLASTGALPVGPSASRNRGLAAATGRLVTFLDADDLWAPGFLAARVTTLDGAEDLGLAWGPARYWYPDHPELSFEQPTGLAHGSARFERRGPLAGWLRDLRTTPCTCATVFRRDALVAVGGFPEALRRGEDIAACLLVAADHASAFDPEVLVQYRRHPASATATSARRGSQSLDDLDFGRWAVNWTGGRPDLAGLRPLAARGLHSLAHRAVRDLGPVAGRLAITRTVLAQRGARRRGWAVALDWVLPLAWSRRVAGRLEGPVGHDGD